MWSKGDPYKRDGFGCPPMSYGDLAFVQHMVASLNDKGRMAVVVPLGVLFRAGTEGTIREGLVRADLLEAVIGLGPNLFYGTGIPAAILLLNKNKAKARRGKLLLVDGSEEFVPGRNQNQLADTNLVRMAKAFRAYTNEERFCRVVDLAELEKQEFNMNISRYVKTSEDEDTVDVAAEVKKLRVLLKQREAAESKVNTFLEDLGYVP